MQFIYSRAHKQPGYSALASLQVCQAGAAQKESLVLMLAVPTIGSLTCIENRESSRQQVQCRGDHSMPVVGMRCWRGPALLAHVAATA